MRIEGVLCDLDGTLVDSEQTHLDAWNALLERNGHFPGSEWNRDCIGLPDTYARDKAIRLYPDMAEHDDLLNEKHTLFRQMIAAKTNLAYPGVRDGLIRLAQAGIKLAVCTNSKMQNTRLALETAGLLGFFL